MGVYEEIFEFTQNLEIIDTHEHLPLREDERDKNTDVLKEYLLHYFNRDLLSAGLPHADYARVIDHKLPLMERWKLVEPFWDIARITGYGRALDISVKELYDIEQIDGSTVEELNRRFVESLLPGHFYRVLKEKSRIVTCLLDSPDALMLESPNLGADPTFFHPVYRMDRFVFPRSFDEIQRIGQSLNKNICSFRDWLDACESTALRAISQGAVAFKSGLAYVRSLLFERCTQSKAEACFLRMLKSNHFPDWELAPLSPTKPFQDYMMHFILRFANEHSMTYQFHTGLQEGGGNFISHSDPALLANLLLDYPQVRFDLMHIGYPYQQTLSALAKNFPNVYIDMCWAHIISPAACQVALDDWLDSVPCNKISAFGGDYRLVDGVFGHQYLARVNVSKVLARKVSEGLLDMSRAQKICTMLFYSNPKELFRLT